MYPQPRLLIGRPATPLEPAQCEVCWSRYQEDSPDSIFLEPRVVPVHLYSPRALAGASFRAYIQFDSAVLRSLCGAKTCQFTLEHFSKENRSVLRQYFRDILWEYTIEEV